MTNCHNILALKNGACGRLLLKNSARNGGRFELSNLPPFSGYDRMPHLVWAGSNNT